MKIPTIIETYCSFNGRLNNAIGITYPQNHLLCFNHEPTEKEVRLALYEKYEHISGLSWNNYKIQG